MSGSSYWTDSSDTAGYSTTSHRATPSSSQTRQTLEQIQQSPPFHPPPSHWYSALSANTYPILSSISQYSPPSQLHQHILIPFSAQLAYVLIPFSAPSAYIHPLLSSISQYSAPSANTHPLLSSFSLCTYPIFTSINLYSFYVHSLNWSNFYQPILILFSAPSNNTHPLLSWSVP